MAERNGFPMRHLGDGVYASFDGYQVWLHVNSHEAPPVVALEPGVLIQLTAYYREMVDPKRLEPGTSAAEEFVKTYWDPV